jgi:long-subunit acyl-CoA synthetase (AMP-forming)
VTKNQEAFEGLWFKSGDLGAGSKTGQLYLKGRIKLIISGFNVIPRRLKRSWRT